jgi:hypothetical protein
MSPLHRILVLLLGTLPLAGRADSDEWFDRVEEALSWASADGSFRGRLSGTLDATGYWFEQPAPALLHTDDDSLVNAGLQLFLDAQLGARAYVFGQVRVDRGFDPADGDWEIRADEYALRIAVRRDGALNLQAGKFATVVGNWVPRHYLWQNPFITAPLPYENVTGIFDASPATTPGTLLHWANLGASSGVTDYYLAGLRLPVIWGPSYTTGAAVSGTAGAFDYAFEMKNSALSSRPNYWDTDHTDWDHPTFSGRVGYRPNLTWNLGLSASSGAYLSPYARLPAGLSRGDYRQETLALDASYAWHHWQVWAELFAVRFEIPRVGPADTLAYYVELRRKFGPHWSGAVRWNQQGYGTIPDGGGGEVKWGRDTWRIDVAPSYRFNAHILLKLQYSIQHRPLDGRDYAHTFAAQAIMRF